MLNKIHHKIIVVEDGSTDNTALKLRNLKDKIQSFLKDNTPNFLEVKVSNSKIKKLPRPTDLIKIKKIFMK